MKTDSRAQRPEWTVLAKACLAAQLAVGRSEKNQATEANQPRINADSFRLTDISRK